MSTDRQPSGTVECPDGCELCERTPPWKLFEQLADETRIRILTELRQAPDRPLRFSELRARTRTRDSSQFNYHLTRLVGTFVVKTEGGYDLTPHGEHVLTVLCDGAPVLSARPR